MNDRPERQLDWAAELVAQADAILIGAGAGMGVDSGLPDFRGRAGFWNAYPPAARLGLDFAALANPRWFREDPALAWGFYGHRLGLYRSTRPHDGFAILRLWASQRPGNAFVVTSNVDGQFQRAGHSEHSIYEIHGAIEWLQCLDDCGVGVFPADANELTIDLETLRAAQPLPRCPQCGALARPNVLMFGDSSWDSRRAQTQVERMEAWLQALDGGWRLVIVECGAGTAIPSIRRFCETVSRELGARLIRINPREPEVPRGQIGLALGARDALQAIHERLQSRLAP